MKIFLMTTNDGKFSAHNFMKIIPTDSLPYHIEAEAPVPQLGSRRLSKMTQKVMSVLLLVFRKKDLTWC